MHTSQSFEKLMDATGYARRAQQDKLVATLAAPREHPVFVQAGTGVGKSFALGSRAADVGIPGYPAVIASVTNSLLDQYVKEDLPRIAEATGITFVRVLGAKNYVCADSKAGKEDGASYLSPEDRNRWLINVCGKTSNWAIEGEWRAERLTEDYACLGAKGCKATGREWIHGPECVCHKLPECFRGEHDVKCPRVFCDDDCKDGDRGDFLGGCASKRARIRAHTVHVVLTNFHFLYFHQYILEAKAAEAKTREKAAEAKTREGEFTVNREGETEEVKQKRARTSPLLPAFVDLLVDEAHHLPETVRILRKREITPGTGKHLFAYSEKNDTPEYIEQCKKLLKATEMVVQFATEVRKPWGKWDTERPINTVRTAAQAEFLDKYRTMLSTFAGVPTVKEVEGEQVLDYGVETLNSLGIISRLMEGDSNSKWTAVYDQDNPGQINLIPITAHEPFVARMIGNGALVTGTAGDTLPRRCGVREKSVEVRDVGHPFRYAEQMRGWISQHSGVKSNSDDSSTVQARLAEVSAFIRGYPSLILCTSHADVALLAGAIGRQAQRPEIFLQPRVGGSLEANKVARLYRDAVEGNIPSVLIGTASYATGLDLPGELLTRLVLWSFVGMTDHVSKEMNRRYRGFIEEQRHTRVVQSIGRLIRATSDTGEVLVSDDRFWDLLERCDSALDRHLRDIPWSAYPAPR